MIIKDLERLLTFMENIEHNHHQASEVFKGVGENPTLIPHEKRAAFDKYEDHGGFALILSHIRTTLQAIIDDAESKR